MREILNEIGRFLADPGRIFGGVTVAGATWLICTFFLLLSSSFSRVVRAETVDEWQECRLVRMGVSRTGVSETVIRCEDVKEEPQKQKEKKNGEN